MKLTRFAMAALAAMITFAAWCGSDSEELRERISVVHKIIGTDQWQGFERVRFDFEGMTAWIVFPKGEPAEGRPWTWTMQWADAFVPRTGVPALLAQGYTHVTLEAFNGRATDEALEKFNAFQRYLVDDLGFARKANLIGMSWGGFFSVRYASRYPDNIRAIYLDAPLLNFDDFKQNIGPWSKMVPESGSWTDDPRMPINLASPIAKAGIPVLLLYGGVDEVVPPNRNCELFVPRFREAGGNIRVICRQAFGHHPHGIDPDDKDQLALVTGFLRGEPTMARTPAGVPILPKDENRLEINLEAGECWWGGGTVFGNRWAPFGLRTKDFGFDTRRHSFANQTSPLLISSHGRFIWCDEGYKCDFKNGVISLVSNGEKFVTGRDGNDIRSVFKYCSARFFPPSGKTPDLTLISAPQYNTWIELGYHQTQERVLEYADKILANGFPAGVIMIDDTWQLDYGVWQFDPRSFPDPKKMMDELHAKGFKVMLWVCPFVSMDSAEFRKLEGEGGFLRDGAGRTAAIRWWNGVSAVLDFDKEGDRKWMKAQLDRLQKDYDIDGFKFDAGDTGYYDVADQHLAPMDPLKEGSLNRHNANWSKLGLDYPLNEYRASWKAGGQPLVQRLCDKGPDMWSVSCLVPDMISAGLIGSSFVCPDMIGGGMLDSFWGGTFDREAFLRSAQVHALAPMMQFSAAPWRVLSKDDFEIVRKAVATRAKFAPRYVQLAKDCAKSGEPMLRSMDYQFPDNGFEGVIDQFVMGDFLIVAPQYKSGATEREVVLPPGKWRADDGTVIVGPAKLTVKTPIDRIPYFEDVTDPLKFKVSADRKDLTYGLGEKTEFTVTVVDTNGVAVKEGTVAARIDNFGDAVLSEQKFDLAKGNPFKVSGVLDQPGFLRLSLKAPGGEVTWGSNLGAYEWSVAYEPKAIVKGSSLPDDFDGFWREAVAKLDREVPLDAQVEKVPSRCTKDFDFYRISFATFGRRVYGLMSIPVKASAENRYPVVFNVPGAGCGVWSQNLQGSANEIKVFMTVFDWAPSWSDFSSVSKLSEEMLTDLQGKWHTRTRSYASSGISGGREMYWYYSVILGISRVVDWVAERPEADPSRIGYEGTSQGGMFGLVLTGLNPKISRTVVYVPAGCDTLGFRQGGRRSGWPRIVENQLTDEARSATEKWAPYFDGANFATRIKTPIRFVFGYSDAICPPAAVYATFNACGSSDKSIEGYEGMTHGVCSAAYSKYGAWLRGK